MMGEADALMQDGAHAIVEGVRRLGAAWVVRTVTQLLDAYGRLDPPVRQGAVDQAQDAGARAADRVAHELEEFFALPPVEQRTTPLVIIRSLRNEATEVLRDAGVPEVERDPYDARAFPDDVYGIVPKSIVELGDEALGGALLAWGMGKARALREQQFPGEGLET
jgi:hypothetical protein